MTKLTLHEDQREEEEQPGATTVVSKVINNLHMSYTAASTIEISEESTSSISESYSFGETSSSEIGVSVDISQEFEYAVTPAVKGKTSVSLGFSSSWFKEETWERSSTTEYSKSHASTMTWEITCPPRCYCERHVTISKMVNPSKFLSSISSV